MVVLIYQGCAMLTEAAYTEEEAKRKWEAVLGRIPADTPPLRMEAIIGRVCQEHGLVETSTSWCSNRFFFDAIKAQSEGKAITAALLKAQQQK